jgi:1-acyl-sn-glycerol-3-phosphate acyltransferase
MKIIRVLAPLVNNLPESVTWYIGNKVSAFILNKYAKLEIVGSELLAGRIGKPTIFIANHLSNVDGLLLNKVLKKNDVTFLAGVKLNVNPLTAIFLKTVKHILVNPNSADRDAIRKALDILKMGGSILIFPEGTRSRSGAMIKGKRGFLLLARLSQADIVPIALEGTERLLPVNEDDMSQETPQQATVRVHIGQPFRLEKRNRDCDDWDERCVFTAMRKIAEMLSPEYQGVYRID